MQIVIVEADLADAEHQAAILRLTSAYAIDPMGAGEPLPDDVIERLIPGLQAHPTTRVFFAYADGRPAGLATCFGGFSTFEARPLLNVHDFAVLEEFRGHGVGRRLLAAVCERAKSLGCCKVTLEVRQDNDIARGLYETEGFSPAAHGGAGYLFYAKRL